MQARGINAQNQQNQNPNVNAFASTSATGPTEVKANLESVLEISMDKRNVKNNRGGKRKRMMGTGVPETLPVATTSGVQ